MIKTKRILKTPCEYVLWYILPAVRKEIAKILVVEHKLKQRSVADMLSLTEAAVSNYVREKRGKNIMIDKKIKHLLKTVAARMATGKCTTNSTCELCKLIRGDESDCLDSFLVGFTGMRGVRA